HAKMSTGPDRISLLSFNCLRFDFVLSHAFRVELKPLRNVRHVEKWLLNRILTVNHESVLQLTLLVFRWKDIQNAVAAGKRIERLLLLRDQLTVSLNRLLQLLISGCQGFISFCLSVVGLML